MRDGHTSGTARMAGIPANLIGKPVLRPANLGLRSRIDSSLDLIAANVSIELVSISDSTSGQRPRLFRLATDPG